MMTLPVIVKVVIQMLEALVVVSVNLDISAVQPTLHHLYVTVPQLAHVRDFIYFHEGNETPVVYN